MATMHYLFFGLLLVALHGIGHTGHPAVTQRHLADSYRVFAAAHPQQRIVAAFEAVLAHNSQKCWLAPGLRDRIIDIAAGQLGVSEATGNNDGSRVEEYRTDSGLRFHPDSGLSSQGGRLLLKESSVSTRGQHQQSVTTADAVTQNKVTDKKETTNTLGFGQWWLLWLLPILYLLWRNRVFLR